MPQASSASVGRALLVLALSLAAALVQTAPLGLHLTTHIPLGNYPAPSVPLLNLWELWWNGDRLTHAYGGYWQAPIFYPDPYSFAYSEALWLPGVVAGGLSLLGASPVLAYNLLVLAAFVLNGCSGYLLLRRVHLRFWPATCGALVIEMLSITADQMGVIQSLMVFPVLMTLACLVRFGRTGRLASALGAALWMAACYHTSSNTALLFGPAAALAVLVLAGRRLWRPRSVAALALAALLGAALVAPIALPQARVLEKVQPHRPEAVIQATSARLDSYARTPATSLLRRRPPDRKEHSLYPGTGVMILAALGACYGLRRRRLRRWTLYCLLAAATCMLLSFGPLLRDQWLGSVLGKPYELLRGYYPGFRFARSLWRFGGLAQVFVALLAAPGFAWCFGSRRSRGRTALGSLVAIVVLAELLATPIPLIDLGESPTRFAWVQWLRSAPPETTIIHLPMAGGALAEDFARTAYWMYCQTYHGRRMANGYSAYVPGHTVLLMQLMPRFPDAESIRALRYFGVSHVLAGSDWTTSEQARRLDDWRGAVMTELATEDMTIYRIVGAVPRSGPRP